jgi:hypothetical protein
LIHTRDDGVYASFAGDRIYAVSTEESRIMTKLKTRFAVLVSLAFTAALFSVSQGVLAQTDSPTVERPGINIGSRNASDGIQGRVLTEKHVIYSGDPLDISLRFARGARLITSGTVDASVVIFTPYASTQPIVLPVDSNVSVTARRLFKIEAADVSTLPAGLYQLGLILTVPGGDPLVLSDWYRGLLGMVDVIGIRITDVPLDDDANRDGHLDDDANGNGFSDDDK